MDPNQCIESISGFDIFLDGGRIDSMGESTIIEIENKEIKILRRGIISEKKLFSLI